MVLNVACRTVSGPLSIKGDHSDIMYTLNTGWLILFANTPQAVYDFNLCALKIAERVRLPVIVAFDGFFTSHQKRKCFVFEEDGDVQVFIGRYDAAYSALDFEHPVTIGSYMNEPDVLNNKYQLHQAMVQAMTVIPEVFREYEELSGRAYHMSEQYRTEDADTILFLLGSSYHTAKTAVDNLRKKGKKVGVMTTNVLRPYPAEAICGICRHAKTLIIADRQDSYGGWGGNLSIECKAALQERHAECNVISRVYGLGGRDFYEEDALELFGLAEKEQIKIFDYFGIYPGEKEEEKRYFAPLRRKDTEIGAAECRYDEKTGKMVMQGGMLNETAAMPKRLAPGHGACPGCGIPVNVNMLLRGIEGNVVLLFQTGCGMVVTTAYPKTSFKIPYIHNLFQSGAATLSGLAEMFRQRQKRGEYPEGTITFIMVSGDGGMDIGLGSALATALRGNHVILFEYDNGGYMNTGYQLSYSTPKGAKSATSHIGEYQYGKSFFHKDTPMLFAATGMPYVATVAESNPVDFIKKAAKAKAYAEKFGTAYVKTLSACPLNWNDRPNLERDVIGTAVNSCYFPLFEVEQGITSLSYNPETAKKKVPVSDWFSMMGRTKHLLKEEYRPVMEEIQNEIDRRWERLKARAAHPLL